MHIPPLWNWVSSALRPGCSSGRFRATLHSNLQRNKWRDRFKHTERLKMQLSINSRQEICSGKVRLKGMTFGKKKPEGHKRAWCLNQLHQQTHSLLEPRRMRIYTSVIWIPTMTLLVKYAFLQCTCEQNITWVLICSGFWFMYIFTWAIISHLNYCLQYISKWRNEKYFTSQSFRIGESDLRKRAHIFLMHLCFHNWQR